VKKYRPRYCKQIKKRGVLWISKLVMKL